MTIVETTSIAAFLLNIGVAVIGATWGVSKIREGAQIQASILRDEFDLKLRASERAFGETINAIRQKIVDGELWNRDHFVRRDSFLLVSQKFEESLSSMVERMERRLDRVEEKLDELRDRPVAATPKA